MMAVPYLFACLPEPCRDARAIRKAAQVAAAAFFHKHVDIANELHLLRRSHHVLVQAQAVDHVNTTYTEYMPPPAEMGALRSGYPARV